MAAKCFVDDAQIVNTPVVVLNKLRQEFLDFRSGDGAVFFSDQIVVSGFQKFNIIHAFQKGGKLGISVVADVKLGKFLLENVSDFAQCGIFPVIVVFRQDS